MRWGSSGNVEDRSEATQLQLPLIAGVLSTRPVAVEGFDVMLVFPYPTQNCLQTTFPPSTSTHQTGLAQKPLRWQPGYVSATSGIRW
jgi:hypothetical protein